MIRRLCPPDDGRESLDWKIRFSYELRQSSSILYDRLGPVSALELHRLAEHSRTGIIEEIDSRASSAFRRTLQNGAQETALAILPVDDWLGILPDEEGLRAFARRLFRGAFGYTAEQELSDLSVAYSATEYAWRQDQRERRDFAWGIRPRRNPYVFGEAHIGHSGDRPALTLIGRVKYLPFDRMQVSANATLPLPHSIDLTIGALCEPLRYSETTTGSIRIERVVKSFVIYAGAQYNDNENLFVCGLSMAW